MKYNLIDMTIIVAFTLGLLISCRRNEVTPIETKGTLPFIHAVGYIEPPGELRRLAFHGHGTISAVECPLGAKVKAGETLARLDDRVERARLTEAQTKLLMAEAQYNLAVVGAHPDAIHAAEALFQSAELEMRHYEREQQRMEGLRTSKGVAEIEIDASTYEAQSAIAKSKGALAELNYLKNQVRPEDRVLAGARVQSARAELASAQVLLDQRILRAPSDGSVVDIFLQSGESVSPSVKEAVILFAPAGSLEVRAEVDEQLFARIKLGDNSEIRSRAGLARIKGTVRMVKPVMGRKTVFAHDATDRMDLQIIEVWIKLAESPEWPIGAEVDVEIEGSGPAER